MFQLKLEIIGGDAKRTDVPIKKLPATIGRAREATITLPHSLVSRKHCEIFEQENQLFVKDLKSLNGTYVNNQKITEPTAILCGQLLTLGNVTFRAIYSVNSDGEMIRPSIDAEQITDGLDDDETLNSRRLAENTVPVEPKETEQPVAKKEQETDEKLLPEPVQREAVKAVKAVEQVKSRVSNEPVPALRKDDDRPHFVFDDEISAAEKSISLGALADLPDGMPQASFAGGLDLSAEERVQVDDPAAVQIEAEEAAKPAASQSSLENFFRKMPK